MRQKINVHLKFAAFALGILFFIALIAPKLWALGDVYLYDTVGSSNAVCDVGPRGNNGTTYDNNGCNNNDHQTILRTGQTTQVPEQTTVVQANFYLPGGPGSGNPRIVIRGANICVQNPSGPNARDAVTNGYYSYNAQTPADLARVNADGLWGQVAVNYRIGKTQGTLRDVATGRFLHAANAGCDIASSTSDITVNVTAADLVPVEGVANMYYTLFKASHEDLHNNTQCTVTSNTGINGPCDGIVNSFILRILGGGAGGNITTTSQFDKGDVCGSAASCVTVQSRNGDDNSALANFTTFKFRFGSDCHVPAGGDDYNVQFYDLDYGIGGSPDTTVKVTMHDQTDDRWLVDVGGGNPGWEVGQPNFGSGRMLLAPRQNGDASQLRFTAYPDHKYVLYVVNVRPVLVMQVGTPFDGVYYDNDCSLPNNSLSCTIETTPATMSGPGTLSATVKATPNPTGFVPVNPRTSLTVTRGATNVYSGGPTAAALNATDGTYDATFNGINLATMGLHTFDASIAYNDGTSDKTATCSYSLPMAARPYFSVIGGDIMAEGSIESWNENAPTYAGARSQLAAIAGGDIKNFITDSDVALPSGLAFANATTSATRYGGDYTVLPNTSVPSESSCTANIAGAINLTNLASGIYCANSSVTMSGTVQPNRQITILVHTGNNATVTGDVGYTYASIAAIPRLNVYALGGDVRIASTVTYIHGVYYAQNDFMSCTDAVGATIPDPAVYDTCNLPLDIYGQVTARGSLVLHRASGDVSSTPAERFIYSPETWLAPGEPRDTYQSYVSLPPVL